MIPGDLETWLLSYSTVLIFVAAIPANVFPVVYSRRPWHRTFVGRALMVKAVGVALLVDTSIFRIVAGNEYEWLVVVRAIVYTIITVGLTLQCIALLSSDRAQRQLERATDPGVVEGPR